MISTLRPAFAGRPERRSRLRLTPLPPAAEAHHHVQAGGVTHHRGALAEVTMDGAEQRIAPALVDAPRGGAGRGEQAAGLGIAGLFGSVMPFKVALCFSMPHDGKMLGMTITRDGDPIGDPVPGWTPRPLPARAPMPGRYCRLEPLSPDAHARDLWEANALDTTGRNVTYLLAEPFATFDDYEAWVRQAAAKTDVIFFAVLTPDGSGHRAVGVASYLRIAPDAGSIEVGHINFSPRLQRTRAATEAMYLMMRHAFELGYRRYEWKCDSLNAPSRRAAQRLGLSFEGVFRQALVYKGRNRDTAWYAAIDQEWPRLAAVFEQWLDPSNFDAEGRQHLALADLTSPILAAPG